jgi:pimeloyl-ACP methyl ester carboxylesterase
MGAGPPTAVFLHGLVMDNLASFFYTLAPAVAEFADVVLFDQRGHGLSERPPSGYSVPFLVDDLNALLTAMDVHGPVWLVGHSYGGLVALAFSFAHHDRVAGMVLLDPLVPQAGWQEPMASTLELRGRERDLRISESFSNWLGRHSRRKSTRLARTAEKLVIGTTLIQDIRTSPSLTDDDIAGISCPVLVLTGEHSDVRTQAQSLSRIMPDCTVEVVPGCTHSVLWEETDQVRNRITDWLETRADGC